MSRTSLEHRPEIAKSWRRIVTTLALLLISGTSLRAGAQPGRLDVMVDKPGHKISPMLNGLMTEEINHSYDGGLYAELIQNRAFKDNATRPVHWSAIQENGGAASIELDNSHPVNEALTTCLKLSVVAATPQRRAGIANDGYWGIPVTPRTTYRCSFFARTGDGFRDGLTVSLESSDGATVHARETIPHLSDKWQQYSVTLRTGNAARSTANRLVLSTPGIGTIYFNLVSLFPPTFHNRPNGTRRDLMELMGQMKPAFLRFPGGNYLEGNTIAERFDWKKTIGPISQRPGHQCPWGYRSTDGFGLLEFLEWCEDLKMEPLLAVFAGYALRQEHIAPGPDLQPFVQDALDEIEYVTGDANTRWGARRIADGHREPFKLAYVEVGNEDEFDRSRSYDGRYTQFYDAIKARYPKLQVIATAAVRTRKPDVIDDHYYRSAREMARDSKHYDSQDRNGTKVFVGEWASTEGSPTPTMQAALGDAAWLTGLERDSDLVLLQCYAPLLVNVNPGARQWGTNLIGYDAMSSFGSPSYYVQSMFAQNRGDVVLPVSLTPQHAEQPVAFTPKGRIGVGSWATEVEYKDAVVTQGDTTLFKADFANGLSGFVPGAGSWSVKDGALAQSSNATDCRAVAGDVNWTDYTYRVKARKISGDEGFLVLFHVENRNNYIWWNIGGWGNMRTALERSLNGAKRELGQVAPVTVEPGRWYDIRVEVQGSRIRCYLDDKLITEAVDNPSPPVEPLYATASRERATGDVIVKVVNVSASAQELQVALKGLTTIAGGTIQQLHGDPEAVNSIAEPMRVAPRIMPLAVRAPEFTQAFPAHSVSVLRLKTR